MEEFEAKQKEVEAVAMPIMTKVYQAGSEGGMGAGMGGMPGGFPGAAPNAEGGAGPSVEEVD
jgi:L1 cell adhesion molecule like protein